MVGSKHKVMKVKSRPPTPAQRLADARDGLISDLNSRMNLLKPLAVRAIIMKEMEIAKGLYKVIADLQKIINK